MSAETNPRNDEGRQGCNPAAFEAWRDSPVSHDSIRPAKPPARPFAIEHAEFEAARRAMLGQFRLLLTMGAVRGLSTAVEIVGETQNTMLQLATMMCDEP